MCRHGAKYSLLWLPGHGDLAGNVCLHRTIVSHARPLQSKQVARKHWGVRGHRERERERESTTEFDTKQDITYTGFRVFGGFEEQLAHGKQSDQT